MLSPAEAEQIILASLAPLPTDACALADAHGRVLRVPVAAEREQPAFDRVTMDGYALRFSDWEEGARRFAVAGFQPAGAAAKKLDRASTCWEIATGAVVPGGADCVVPYEEVSREGDFVDVPPAATLRTAQNIHRRGSDAAAGQVLLEPGIELRPHHVAVAAACGCAVLQVAKRPRIGIVVTGDELVEADTPDMALHQIRRSNDYALRAALLRDGSAGEIVRFHLRDDMAEVEKALQTIVAGFDVILLTGGISKGKKDLLPAGLAAAGVVKKFQGVAQRPGKPFWFGLTPRGSPVFALPGNPVSTYACFHRYVRPALAKLAGRLTSRADYVVLAQSAGSQGNLAYLLPVHLETDTTGRRTAIPHSFNTSGDFASLAGTDGFVELPPSKAEFPRGTVARFWEWS